MNIERNVPQECPVCKKFPPCLAAFAKLKPTDLAWLQRISKSLFLEKDQSIFVQGGLAHEVFILCQGKVQLIRSENGQTRAVQFLRAGDVVGAAALMGQSHHCTCAVALEVSCVRLIPVGDFRELCDRSPTAAWSFLDNLASQLERSRKFAYTLLRSGSRRKLAGLLLELADIYGRDCGHTVKIELSLTDRELGKILGLSREMVNRRLNELKSRGLILRERGRLALVDSEGLKRVL